MIKEEENSFNCFVLPYSWPWSCSDFERSQSSLNSTKAPMIWLSFIRALLTPNNSFRYLQAKRLMRKMINVRFSFTCVVIACRLSDYSPPLFCSQSRCCLMRRELSWWEWGTLPLEALHIDEYINWRSKILSVKLMQIENLTS